MVKIPVELLKEILYFINDWLRLMGYGREYARLSRVVWGLSKAGVLQNVNVEKFYYVSRVIEAFQRLEKIERSK